VLFTDVTDAYRLGRRGRLRTDLGGIYFNAVFIAALGAAYGATHFEPLLAAVMIQHAVILDQLMPWLRFDGYYVISDLTGTPDILTRVRPALETVLRRRPHPDFVALPRRARRLLMVYLASLVAFVAIALATTAAEGPTLLSAAWESLHAHAAALRIAVDQGRVPTALVESAQVALLASPGVGSALTAALVISRAVQARARWWARLAAQTYS